MNSAVQYPHIFIESDGTARVGNSRYKLQHLAAEHYYHGWSAEELLRQHPDLRPEEIYAALTYFYDQYDSIVEQLKKDANHISEAQADRPTPLTREELLKRRKIAEPA